MKGISNKSSSWSKGWTEHTRWRSVDQVTDGDSQSTLEKWASLKTKESKWSKLNNTDTKNSLAGFPDRAPSKKMHQHTNVIVEDVKNNVLAYVLPRPLKVHGQITSICGQDRLTNLAFLLTHQLPRHVIAVFVGLRPLSTATTHLGAHFMRQQLFVRLLHSEINTLPSTTTILCVAAL